MEFFTHLSSFTPKWRRGQISLMQFAYLILLFYLCISEVACDKESDKKTMYSDVKTEVLVNGRIEEKDDKFAGMYGHDTLQNINNPIKGMLVNVYTKVNKSKLGCSELDPSIIPSKNWIALVHRGDCKFSAKIYFAAKMSNASAVIIIDFKDSDNSIMSSVGRKQFEASNDQYVVQDKTAIMVSYEKGQELLGLMKKYRTVNVTISWRGVKEQATTGHNGQLNNTSVLFVSISFIVLIIISLAWLVFYYIQRCRYTNAKERLSRRLANAAKKAIAKIPQRSVRFGDKELEADADQCAVCIEPYKISDVIRVLPCKHVFHKSCVDPWLLDQRSCPMCKMDILRAFGMHLNDSQESVPQDAESGLISSTPPADEADPVSQHEEQGAVGGVKIVLYQHPLRYTREGPRSSTQYPETEFNSDTDSYSTPLAECHVECTSHAVVEHNIDTHTDSEHENLVESQGLVRSDSTNSVHSNIYEEDRLSAERHSLIGHLTSLSTSHEDNSKPTDSLMG